jgi:GTP-binding protein HflX
VRLASSPPPPHDLPGNGRGKRIGNRRPAVLVAAVLDGGSRAACEEHLDELGLLADTAGLEVRGRLIQERTRPAAGTFLGSGKIAELASMVSAQGAERVVFDDDLTAQQVYRLEREVGAKVLDRSGLILEIFAARARSREARAQVELASLRYLLPRLAGRWSHLSRQEGGIGVRGGVGETQIEIDRRLIRRRISLLERELASMVSRRHSSQRRRQELFGVALVGYTNSGKSTLFNRLTGADALVEDRLFATLDPLRRRLADGDGASVVLTDTVGFIRKLPHHLVAAFRSTLEEAGEADLLLEVADMSDPGLEEKRQATAAVLNDLDLGARPRLLVLNKADAVVEPSLRLRLERRYPEALVVSALSGEGVGALRDRLLVERARREVVEEARVGADHPDVLALLTRHGRILSILEEGRGDLLVTYSASPAAAGRIRRALTRLERSAAS